MLGIKYLWIILLTGFYCNMDFEIDKQTTYNTTVTRAVGPTTETGIRGTLPQTAPDDVNSIWVSLNGNDGNLGTEGSPKRTIINALASTTGSKNTVHIFRDGFTGELVFNETGAVNIITTRNIQVEQGETAKITVTTPNTFTFGGGGGGAWSGGINGIIFEGNEPAALFGNDSGSTGTIENCTFINNNTTTINAHVFDLFGSPSLFYNTKYCVFVGFRIFENLAPTTSDTIENNIFIGLNPSFSTSGLSPQNRMSYVIENQTATNGINIAIKRNIFYGFDALINGNTAHTSDANATDFNFDSCTMQNITHVAIVEQPTSGTEYYNYNFDYCQLANAGVGFVIEDNTTAGAVDVTLDETNAIDPDLNPMFTNLSGALTPDYPADGFRLQAEGKDAGNGQPYLIDSPLIDAGLSSVDISPWDESTTLTSEAFNSLLTIKWPPSLLNISNEFVNSSSISDILGNPHSDYDSIRKAFNFTFGGGNHYANNDDLRRLINIMADNGSLRFYPFAKGSTIFVDPETGNPDAVNGTFDSSDNTLAPNIVGGVPMVKNNWRGFWIIINDGGTDKHFYIESNTLSKFTLVDKLGETFPTSGLYDFTIEYILVKSTLENIAIAQQFFTNFLKGGAFREQGQTRSLAHEMKGHQVSFIETSEHEDNTKA